MSKHTWLTKPTEAKAERLKEAFMLAREAGASHSQAAGFAGYCVERAAQASTIYAHSRMLLPGAVRSNWRCANRPEYHLLFRNHLSLILGEEVQSALRAFHGPAADEARIDAQNGDLAAAAVLADMLEEAGITGLSDYVRAV